MPYSGIPADSEMEHKIDRCVESAMNDDPSLDKSSAIAICRDSIKEKDAEKFMDMMYGAGGAISFTELDANRQAREQAMALMELTHDFQQLVDNIMWSPDVTSKASAIRELSSEFADRLETGNYNKGLTLFKEVWTAQYVNDLPDSSFLFIEDGGTKESGKTAPRSLRHLPYKDDKGAVDLPHLRNALSRLGQSKTGQGWKGFNRESVKSKAESILERESPKKETAFGKFVNLIKGVVSPNSVKSEPEENPNGFFIFKDKGGTYRWIARYSNNFRDDDRPPEIISSKSHQRFEALVDAGIAPLPELWLWHNKDWRIGQSEWIAYDDAGFAMAGGHVFPECEEIAKQLQALSDVGVSHGMKGEFIRRDIADPSIITQHITHEISPLPMWAAANKRTGFVVLDDDKEISMLSKDKRHELVSKWGLTDEYLDALEAMNATTAKATADAGVQRKEANGETPEATPETVPAVEAAQPTEEEEIDVQTDVTPTEEPAAADAPQADNPELLTAVEETMKAVMVMTKEVRDLAAKVKELEGSEEAKIAAKVKQTPLASMTQLLVNSVIGNEETRVDGRTSLAKSGPVETAPSSPSVTGIPLIDGWITNADKKSA